MYEYFLEIDNIFEKKVNFQTKKYKDVVLNSYNNTDKTSVRTSPNKIPNYLFKSIDKILNEISELKIESDVDLFMSFKDYFDMPQIQYILSLTGFLTCKLVISMPINEEIYENIIFKRNDIIDFTRKITNLKETKAEIIEEQKKFQNDQEIAENELSEIEKSIRQYERDLKVTNNKEEIDRYLGIKRNEKVRQEKVKEKTLNDLSLLQTEANDTDEKIAELAEKCRKKN